MTIHPFRFALTLLLAATTPLLQAQSEGAPAAAPAPKTCLVLSGGGARGAAHIGVLRVLEELRVPVDCVIGTSMGAIVGGAYASGVTPQRMEEVIRNARWDRVLSDNPDRPQRSVRTKELERLRINLAEFGVRDRRAVLPRGAVIGQQLELLLQQLYGTPHSLDSFDALPIPFRAIATDIENGQMVVIGKGSVNDAVRASMSVPGAFAPHELDGRLLVDGGLVRNLGVDVARALGARRLIVVNLGTTLAGRAGLDSLLGVTEQMINILTEQNVQMSLAQLTPDDVLISPALGDFSAADFAGAPTVIEAGERAARAQTDRLAAFSITSEQYAAWRTTGLAKRGAASPYTDLRVDTSGLKYSNPQSALAVFDAAQRRGDPETKLSRAIDALYATDDFQQVVLRAERRPDGSEALVIQPQEKTWGPNYARLGLALSTDLEGGSAFTVLGDYRATWLNARGLELRTTAALGDLNALRTELRLPLDLRREWFVGGRIELQQRVDEFFEDNNALARFRSSAWRVGLDSGRRFGTAGELRLGFERQRFRAKQITGSVPVAVDPQGSSAIYGLVTLDRLDSWDFPRSGFFASARVDYADEDLGGEIGYNKLLVELQKAFGRERHSLALTLRHGDSLGTELPAFESISLGGFQNLSGLRERQILANRATFGRAVYSYRIASGGTFARALYIGSSIEAARVEERINSLDPNATLLAGSLFISADTALGPLYFGAGLAEGGSSALYLFLGRP